VTRVFLDIETIPTTSPDEMARIAADVLAHNGSLKKPHGDDEVRRLVDEAHRKTSFDGSLGEVVVIAAAIDDGPVCSWSRDYRVAGSEADLLTRFRNDMHDALDGHGAVVVGHNAMAFDRVFLRQRGLVVGVSLPAWLTATVKPWEAAEIDTMLMWTGGAPGKTISLDRLARSLGIGGKASPITGDKVWDAICAGQLADVVAYCEADVDLTRRCFHRMRAVGAEAHQ